MPFDDLTLMFTLSVAAFCGAAAVALSANMSDKLKGTKYWALGLIFIGVAFAINVVFPSGSSARSLFYNLSLLAGHSLWLAGTWQYVGNTHTRHLLFAVFALIALPTIYFSLFNPDRDARILLIGLWLIAVRASNAAILVGKTQKSTGEQKAAWGFVVLAAIEITATVVYNYTSLIGSQGAIGHQAGTLSMLTWLGALLGILLGVPLLMLLTSGRLITQLEEAANKDVLTNLLNRRGFYTSSEVLLSYTKRKKLPFAVMMIDVDNFKRINDVHGHNTGDSVLKLLGECITSTFRKEDVACRWGGEEVCILLTNVTEESLDIIGNRLRNLFTSHSRTLKALENCAVTLSIGVAISEDGNTGFEDLQRQADNALYSAKSLGKDRLCFSTQPT